MRKSIFQHLRTLDCAHSFQRLIELSSEFFTFKSFNKESMNVEISTCGLPNLF